MGLSLIYHFIQTTKINLPTTMRQILLLSVGLLAATFSSAQVSFETFESFDELLERAQKTNKLVFIQIQSSECEQCNDVAMKGLGSSLLKEKYAVNFVSTKIQQGDPLYTILTDKMDIHQTMGSVFCDAKG
jgi:thioredoxin-related protein